MDLLASFGRGKQPTATAATAAMHSYSSNQEPSEQSAANAAEAQASGDASATTTSSSDNVAIVWPRTAAYNEVLAACVREGQHAEAVRLFEEMGVGSAARADRTSLSLAARAVAALGDWERGCRLIEQSRLQGWAPPQSAVRDVMLACGARGEWQAALRLLLDDTVSAAPKPYPPVYEGGGLADTSSGSVGGTIGSDSVRSSNIGSSIDGSVNTSAAAVTSGAPRDVDQLMSALAAATEELMWSATSDHGSEGRGELRGLAM